MGVKNINVAVGGHQSGDYPKVYNTVYIKPNIPFALQVTEPDTKYVIRHKIDLGSKGDTVSDVDFTNAGTHEIAGVEYYYVPFTANGKSYTLIDDSCVFITSDWTGLSERTITPDEGTVFMIASMTGGLHTGAYINAEVVTMPENCILEFDGGSLDNGVIVGQDTVFINVGDVEIWGKNLIREGTWREHSGGEGLSDKPYDPEHYSGLGRKTLELKDDSNILTQEDFDSPNTIYVIGYDFDLDGGTVTIPEGCVLKFDGGSLSSGKITGQSTSIQAGFTKIFNTDINFDGTWDVIEVYPEWFGIIEEDVDSYLYVQKAVDTSNIMRCVCKLLAKKYTISSTIENAFNISGEEQPQYLVSHIHMTGKGPNLHTSGWGKVSNLRFTRSYILATEEDILEDSDAAIKNCFIFLGHYDGQRAYSYRIDNVLFDGTYYNGITMITEADLTTIENVTARTIALNHVIHFENRRGESSNAPSVGVKMRRLFLNGEIDDTLYKLENYNNTCIYVESGESITIEDSVLNDCRTAVRVYKTNNITIQNVHTERRAFFNKVDVYDDTSSMSCVAGNYLMSSATYNYLYRIENSGTINAGNIDNFTNLPKVSGQAAIIDGVNLTCVGIFTWYRITGYEPVNCTITDCLSWKGISFATFENIYSGTISGIRESNSKGGCSIFDNSAQGAGRKLIKIKDCRFVGALKTIKDESLSYYIENSDLKLYNYFTNKQQIYKKAFDDRLSGFNSSNSDVKGTYRIIDSDITITGEEDEDTFFVDGTGDIVVTLPKVNNKPSVCGKRITISKLTDGGSVWVISDRWDNRIPFKEEMLSRRGESITLMSVRSLISGYANVWVCLSKHSYICDGTPGPGTISQLQYGMAGLNYNVVKGSLILLATLSAGGQDYVLNNVTLRVEAGRISNASGVYDIFACFRGYGNEFRISVIQKNAASYTIPKFYYKRNDNDTKCYIYCKSTEMDDYGQAGAKIINCSDYRLVEINNEASDEQVSELTEVLIKENGVVAGTSTYGLFSSKPTVSSNDIPIGFKYFCTDKQSPEQEAIDPSVFGLEIIHKGSDVWVDAIGRIVE